MKVIFCLLLAWLCCMAAAMAQPAEGTKVAHALDSIRQALPQASEGDSLHLQAIFSLAYESYAHDRNYALGLAHAVVERARASHDTLFMVKGLRYMADRKRESAEHEESSRLLFEALELIKHAPENIYYARVCLSLGLLYQARKEYTLSHRWQLKAYQEYLKHGKTGANGAAACLINMGNVFSSPGPHYNLDSSLSYYQKVIDLADAYGFEDKRATAYNNIGHVHMLQSHWSQAIAFNERALAINRRLKRGTKQVVNLNNLGESYMNIGQYALAQTYLDTSLHLAEAVAVPYYLRQSLHYNKENLKRLGRHREALEVYERWRVYDDSLRAEGVTKQLLELQAKYDLDVVERENQRLAAEAAAKGRRLTQSRIMVVALSLAFITVLVILLWLRSQRKRTLLGRELEQLRTAVSTLTQEKRELQVQLYQEAMEQPDSSSETADALDAVRHNADALRVQFHRMEGLMQLMENLKEPNAQELGRIVQHYQQETQKARRQFGTLFVAIQELPSHKTQAPLQK